MFSGPWVHGSITATFLDKAPGGRICVVVDAQRGVRRADEQSHLSKPGKFDQDDRSSPEKIRPL